MPASRHGRGPYLKRLREAAFARGLCYECTAHPVVFGRRRCEACNKKNRERLAAKFANGECRGLCGAQRAPGHSRCDACRAQQREYMRQRRIAAGKTPRTRRVQPLSTSAVPSTREMVPAPVERAAAEVDLPTRRQVIAALAARRAA